jgi:hypothetical protein
LAGYTARNNGLVRVELEDGYWVEVKTHLSHGETKRAKQALMDATLKVVDEVSETSAKIDMIEYEQEIAMAGIIAWNLDDADGNILPLSPETAKRASIDLMDTDDFDKVVAVVSGVSKKKAGASEKKFPK